METKWKIIDLLQTVSEFLKGKGIDNPRLNAELLLGKVLNLSRVQLYLAFERPLSNKELEHYRELVRRRANHEPLQYILQETEFMGLRLKVRPGVLIPRPETEMLVEQVLQLKEQCSSAPTIIDVGTGSGCIALSIAHFWPEAKVMATDVSDEALEIFYQNQELNELNGRVIAVKHDIMSAWSPKLPTEFEILVSNPPYISLEEIKTLPKEVQQYEPMLALSDQADGLSFYRRFLQLVQQKIIKPEYMLFEMSGLQAEKIINLAQAANLGPVEVIEDLNQMKRILKIRVENG